MISILVLEDDVNLNRILSVTLKNHNYDVVSCHHAEEAFHALDSHAIQLIISDIMMPDIDGYEFAQAVRDYNAEIPILFMSALDDFESKQKGFRVGIDDYMVKPVNFDELLLRVEALLRRAKISNTHELNIGSLRMLEEEHSVYVGEEEIVLTVREFDLLYKLLSYPKKIFTRQQLLDAFWDPDSEVSPRVVDVYITKLRDKMSVCKDFEIVTVHGLGYKAVLK